MQGNLLDLLLFHNSFKLFFHIQLIYLSIACFFFRSHSWCEVDECDAELSQIYLTVRCTILSFCMIIIFYFEMASGWNLGVGFCYSIQLITSILVHGVHSRKSFAYWLWISFASNLNQNLNQQHRNSERPEDRAKLSQEIVSGKQKTGRREHNLKK